MDQSRSDDFPMRSVALPSGRHAGPNTQHGTCIPAPRVLSLWTAMSKSGFYGASSSSNQAVLADSQPTRRNLCSAGALLREHLVVNGAWKLPRITKHVPLAVRNRNRQAFDLRSMSSCTRVRSLIRCAVPLLGTSSGRLVAVEPEDL